MLAKIPPSAALLKPDEARFGYSTEKKNEKQIYYISNQKRATGKGREPQLNHRLKKIKTLVVIQYMC